jgi:dipeptidyl aminopeptidase/acylaminoacyl peptidase
MATSRCAGLAILALGASVFAARGLRSRVLAAPADIAPITAGGATLVAPGVVSTGDSESHATLSPDGRSLYFVKLTPDFAHWTVVVSERSADGWGEPTLAWFSGGWDDADVSFSPDGNTLFFVSNRPDGENLPARTDTDLFRMRRTPTAAGWGAPERIAELSSPGNEWFPTQTSDGTLYFGSERRVGNLGPEGTSDLWRARWLGDRFGEPENLGRVINGEGQEIEPWVAPDESRLVFAAKGRPDSLGSYDLYVSYRCGDAWSQPRPLGPGVNSSAWEFGGRFSPDGAVFFFTSNHASERFIGFHDASERITGPAILRREYDSYRGLLERLRSPGNGLFDIYAVETAALGLADPCAPGS